MQLLCKVRGSAYDLCKPIHRKYASRQKFKHFFQGNLTSYQIFRRLYISITRQICINRLGRILYTENYAQRVEKTPSIERNSPFSIGINNNTLRSQ